MKEILSKKQYHLEADMITTAAKTLNPKSGAILTIESAGNLACPAMFDPGEKG